MPKINAGLFWLMGISAMLSLGKAKASDYPKWPDSTMFLKTALAGADNMRVDTIFVTNEFDIDPRQAFTNAKTYEIVIKYFQGGVSKAEYEKKYPRITSGFSLAGGIREKMSATQEYVSYDQLIREIELMNNNIPAVIVHELQHRKNRVLYSDNFDNRQIALFNMFDEISARIAELMFSRAIFLKNRDVKNAFLGPQSRKSSEVFTDDWSLGAKSYADWLRRNPNINETLSKDEVAQIMKTAALDILAHDWKNYVQPMSALLKYQIGKRSNKGQQTISDGEFSKILDEMCMFDGVNFLKDCGADVTAKVMNFTNTCVSVLENNIAAQMANESKAKE